LNFIYLSLDGGQPSIRGSPKMINRQAGVLPALPILFGAYELMSGNVKKDVRPPVIPLRPP
jgi:hypothetical protein